jgi:hypothetical protein
MIYMPMHGVRRFIPISRRVSRALKGLDGAVRERKLFHLWFHPTNLADHLAEMFEGLRTVLRYAHQLREHDQLLIVPMGAVPQAFGALAA